MRVLGSLVVACAIVGTMRAQSDSLETARERYIAAEYVEALGMLERVAGTPGLADRERAQIEQYRALCLLALNRPKEAAAAVEAMVRKDPLYSPFEEDLSPRTRQLFRDVRLGLLPALAQERYVVAKAAYEAGRATDAVAGFEAVIGILDQVEATGAAPPLVADLRVLATGFRELAQAAAQPLPPPDLPPPAPAYQAAPAPPTQPGRPLTVTPPVTVRQTVPAWPAELPVPELGVAVVEVVIGIDGRVQEARLQKALHPRYDRLLLSAARDWLYRPALRDGQPTPYVKAVRIELSRRP